MAAGGRSVLWGQEDRGSLGTPCGLCSPTLLLDLLTWGCSDASWHSRAHERRGSPEALGPFSSGGGKGGVSLPQSSHTLSSTKAGSWHPRALWALSWAALQGPAGGFAGVHVGERVSGGSHTTVSVVRLVNSLPCPLSPPSRPSSPHPSLTPGMFSISQMKNRPMILIGG